MSKMITNDLVAGVKRIALDLYSTLTTGNADLPLAAGNAKNGKY